MARPKGMSAPPTLTVSWARAAGMGRSMKLPAATRATRSRAWKSVRYSRSSTRWAAPKKIRAATPRSTIKPSGIGPSPPKGARPSPCGGASPAPVSLARASGPMPLGMPGARTRSGHKKAGVPQHARSLLGGDGAGSVLRRALHPLCCPLFLQKLVEVAEDVAQLQRLPLALVELGGAEPLLVLLGLLEGEADPPGLGIEADHLDRHLVAG